MVETVSQNAQRIREYSMEEGNLEVERFLDSVLSISDHIDPFPRREPDTEQDEHEPQPGHHWVDPYGELFPPKLETSLATGRPLKGQRKGALQRRRVPAEPEKDLLRFLLEHGDQLEDWQRDVIAIVREESLYFVPQMQTKIMNEGWASYWHSRILREVNLDDGEYLEFMRLHSSVLTPGRNRLNPYYVGYKMFEDIEQRFGREKMFEIREMENDASFIRNYLTEELVRDLDLFVFQLEDDAWTVTDKAWERVRDAICESMTNFGQPYIVVEDGDYGGRRELYLRHHHDGRDLDEPYAERTLQHIHAIWGHPVHLETIEGDRGCILTCDGDNVVKVYL